MAGITDGIAVTPRSDDGAPLIEVQPRHGSELVVATHNLCDKTAWYGESIRKTDVVSALSGDGLSVDLGEPAVDVIHGKIHGEDDIVARYNAANEGDPHGYGIVVKADDVELTQRTPFEDEGGDYTVDYATGVITFESSQSGKEIKVSYSTPASSVWKLVPNAGKKIRIEQAAAQFTTDVEMNGSLSFSVHGLVDVFAPQLLDTADPPGPLPSGTKIELVKETYKTIQNFIEEALGAFPGIPAFGGAKRGLTSDVYEFPFRYGTTRDLSSAAGMELHLQIDNDKEYGGSLANATFYCTVTDDPDWPDEG